MYPRPIKTISLTHVRVRLWRLVCAWLCVAVLALPLGGAQAQSVASVAVIVTLKAQPYGVEAQGQQAAFEAQAAAVLAQVQAAAPAPGWAGGQPASTAAEVAAAQASLRLSAASQARLEQALAELDALLAAQRRAVYAAALPKVAASQAPVEALIAQLGGRVTARLRVINALAAQVPAGAVAALEQHPAVAAVTIDTLAVGALETGPSSLHAESFWDAGFTGGALDLAVIDTGVDGTHPAFAGHNFLQGRFLTTAEAFSNGSLDPTPDDLHGHGTHVAGITGSTTPGLRGVAYGYDTLLNAKAGWDTNGPLAGGGSAMYESDSMAAVEWALFGAAESADVLNLSFASCTANDDTNWARFFDAVVGVTGITAAVAAGNSGSCTRVTSPSIAYNVISVANVNDQETADRADDTLNPTSLPGPTVGGRLKPDLAAPGTNINSANAAWETAGDFKLLTGTSMAAPHVAGAAALLMQAGVADPRAVRALLINTAEDRGTPGWDAGFGWGYIDLAHTFAHPADVALSTVSVAAPYRLYMGPALAGDRATLAWHRHVAYPCVTCSQVVPVTNLDLALYAAASNALLDTSAQVSDTVEQVQAPTASDLNVVRVGLVSMDGALSEEDFALATEEGFTPATGPLLMGDSMAYVAPVGEPRAVSLRVTNTGDLPAHGVVVTVTVPAGFTLPVGDEVYNVGMLEPGAVYTVPYAITLEQDEARFFGVTATGVGYGNSYLLSEMVGVYPQRTETWLPVTGR